MPATAATDGHLSTALEPFFYDVTSADGTRLQAWTNDPDCQIDGPTVLLCNGLGTNPWTWPALLAPDCGVRVLSWNHRGTGGSGRPLDPERVGIDAFAEDAIAVLDAAGVARATLIGWSMGVNTIFEVALHHPERVSGLLAVAGVPGGTFGTMLAPTRLPRLVREALTVNASRVMKYAGRALTPIASHLPVGPKAIAVVSHSGFMFPVADPEMTARAVKEFLQTPIEWYFHLALHAYRHQRISLSKIDVPAVFVAGKHDLLAGPKDMLTAAERLRDATYVELVGSHFIQMEKPDEVHAELLDLLERVE
jgi:pimeloyl-ACP methyl ester carboxylesterase